MLGICALAFARLEIYFSSKSTPQTMRLFWVQRFAVIWIAGIVSSSCLIGSEAGDATNRVYRFDETMPVKGLLIIRAVPTTRPGEFQPVAFVREKQGWMVVAESFEAYRELLAEKERKLAEAQAAQARTNALQALEHISSQTLDRQVHFVAQRLPANQRARFQAELARQADEAGRCRPLLSGG